MSGKAYRSTTLSRKADAIREIAKGKSKAQVCKEFGVPRTTLNGWLQNQEKILDAVDQAMFRPDRKRMRTALNGDVEACLVQWLRQACANNVPINGPLLACKAVQFASQLGISDFNCNEGWVERFKARHAISLKRACGEGKTIPVGGIQLWKNTTLLSILREYDAKNIYNADETGLFYKMLPNKTLAFRDKRCIDGEHSKQRLTILLMANMDGSDKRKPLVIGKSKNPCCFKNVKSLPVYYTANKKAWMVGAVFEEFVRDFDAEMHTQKRRVALIVDNCPAHPASISGLKAVQVVFLPPNTTSHSQPMDSGVIKTFKAHYRRLLMSKILLAMDAKECFKPDVLMAVQLIKQAWNLVQQSTIASCFCHAGFVKEHHVPPEAANFEALYSSNMNELRSQLQSLGIWPSTLTADDYINFDSSLCVAEQCSDEDIVAAVQSKRDDASDDSEVSDEEIQMPSIPLVKPADARKALDTLQLFLAQQDIDDQLFHFAELSSILAMSACKSTKQKCLTDFTPL
ncbi:tigger transposable element-derived protein 4 [Alligator mississippiensis]|uniref:tigger transposable element-derived protein 4 n=1 Tax=Alligator mississippiensis TaxID=8496 RepID=UPI0006EC8155|nr:tigger transposable element-derived protein 4 [Alligator mississippiensis]XP_059580622.1 tigger transposable element-derived protein 4 [Alligator mississippiensis]